MSGGSQHNPNGRQSQLSSGWSPLQLQMANYLARAPQAHMASERGVTWHTPTPPHLYHVPSPPDPLQAMKTNASAANSVFRHTATPPELYRHTPTPPEKHHMRHTPSPSDHKGGAALPPAELYPHLGPARDKLVRPEDMMPYARGVDLSVSRGGGGGPGGAGPANGAPIALSVRDAPTINSLIARAQPRPAHSRVDSLLERLVPSPVSPHSVIMHSRAGPTPSPPSSNEDSADSCGAPPGSKRKRKPERTVRVPSVPPPPEALTFSKPQPVAEPPAEPPKPEQARLSPPKEAEPATDSPLENGEAIHRNGPELPAKAAPPEAPHTRRKRRSRSAETIDDIAAMIAGTDNADGKDLEPEIVPDKPAVIEAMEVDAPVTIDKLKSVLASPEQKSEDEPKSSPSREDAQQPEVSVVEAAAAPRRRSARTSNSESTNVPVESPSEAKPAEPEASGAKSAEPTPASIVDVEDQLEKMFAGIEAEPESEQPKTEPAGPKGKRRRKSAAAKSEKKVSRRSSRASTGDERSKKKGGKKKGAPKQKKASEGAKDAYAYDSGSNASSGRSRGPYIQIRGPRDSPLSVSVMNAAAGDEDCEAAAARRKPAGADTDFRNGLRTRGLHCSTLGLRYDAITPDATWVCVFCEKGPHAAAGGAPLGDLFGPYAVATDCEEFRALDEVTRSKYDSPTVEVWFHEDCGVWAPGLVAGGARVWGLPGAVWGAAAAACARCGRPGAGLACARRGCPARAHLPCARALAWTLDSDEYRATCPRHA